MSNLYSEDLRLRAPHCDIHGEWRASAILETMQEIAAAHCVEMGIGRPVTDAMGVIWVLTRARVELERAPRMGEKITIQTWPCAPKHLFYPRRNAFWDEKGDRIGSADSLWVLMDIHTRHIVNSDVVLSHIPDTAEVFKGNPLGAIRPLEGAAMTAELMPPYADFDLNGHVNNTKYLDWACNALGHEVLDACYLASFAVSYDAEIRPGVQVRTELVRQGDRFSFCGHAEDRRSFCVLGTLQAREERLTTYYK